MTKENKVIVFVYSIPSMGVCGPKKFQSFQYYLSELPTGSLRDSSSSIQTLIVTNLTIIKSCPWATHLRYRILFSPHNKSTRQLLLSPFTDKESQAQ